MRIEHPTNHNISADFPLYRRKPAVAMVYAAIFLVLFFTQSSFCDDSLPNKDFLNVASMHKEAMEYKKAILAIESSKDFLNSCEDLNFLSRLYYLDGKNDKAIATLVSINDKDWLSYLYLGLAYEDSGDIQVAVKNYLQSLKLNENSLALYRLGKIYYKRKIYHKAARFFSRLLTLDSSTRLANYYLAECFLKTGNYKKAYTYSAKGVNFYPENTDIKKQLSEIKEKIGKAFFLEAKHTIEKTRDFVKLMFYKREKNVPIISVGLATDLKDFIFRCGGNFTISDEKNLFTGEKDKFYKIVFRNQRLYVEDDKSGAVYKKLRSPIFIKSKGYPFYILDIKYGHTNFWHKKIDRIYRGDLKVIVGKDITLVNILSVEEYLYGVLPSEVLASSDKELLKAQAIAARTVAFRSIKQQRHKEYNFDVCADVHCQVYQGMSVENVLTNKAVDETKGEIIFYESQPIEAIYHSNCGGYLRPDVFSNKKYYAQGCDLHKMDCRILPYEEETRLTGFADAFCAHSYKSNYRWQRVYDAEDFALIFGYPLKDIKSIIPREKTAGGAYKLLELETIRGKANIKGDFNIRNYFDKLRSSALKVDIKFSPEGKAKMIFFWGAGFGHGVGMCQEGAEFMAEKGYTYQEILHHYYPHTEVIKRY